jgi:4-amino-4-deoxy-L-arabinose transferase-like glycosyltransferase
MPVAILHETEGTPTFAEYGSVMGQVKHRGSTPTGKSAGPRPHVADVSDNTDPRWRAGIFLILAAAVGIQLIDINRPFIDRHDWATAHQSQLARNHLRYGLAVTKTRCVYTRFVENRPDARRIYPDHPPLLPLVLALGMAAFGESEIAVRAVAGAFTVASIGLTMSLARGLLGRSVSLLAGLALLPMPILVYFGHIPSHETVALPFALLALRGYFGWLLPERFQRRPGRNATLFVMGTVLMILTSWAGLLFAGIIWAHFAYRVVTGKHKRSAGAWCLVTLPAGLATLVTFTHVLWSLEWNLQHMYGLFAYRSGINQSQISFTAGSWFLRQATWLWRDYTALGVTLAGLGLLLAIYGRLRRSGEPSGTLLRYAVPLALPGLLWVLVFRNGSFVHEYWWLHATPFVAMLIALALRSLSRLMRGLGRAAQALTVALLLVSMAAEAAAHYRYFRRWPPADVFPYRPCQYVRAHTPPAAWVLGNRALWSKRDYYEGPQQILLPPVAWYLDRFYVQAVTPDQIAALIEHAPYYMFIPNDEDRALGERLRRTFELEAEWPDAQVFDLRSRAAPPSRSERPPSSRSFDPPAPPD